MLKIPISEIFFSIQGERLLQGIPSVLVRLSGCNLNCAWCDSKMKSSYVVSFEELINQISKYNCKYIILTGGEPLIYKDIVFLTQELKNQGFHITVETNATVKKPIVCDLLSLSPKLMHSGNVDVKLFDPDIIKYYLKNYNYQIKFVVRDQQNNFDEITHLLSLLDTYDLERILIMPMSATKSDLYKIQKKIISLCLKNGYRYSNRLQLQVWGNKKEV